MEIKLWLFFMVLTATAPLSYQNLLDFSSLMGAGTTTTPAPEIQQGNPQSQYGNQYGGQYNQYNQQGQPMLKPNKQGMNWLIDLI
jgi:hypothetical protein